MTASVPRGPSRAEVEAAVARAHAGEWASVLAATTRVARDLDLAAKLPLLVVDHHDEADGFPDDRLRLIFTCCHPALAREAQLALTLRLVAGLSTAEVARALLVKEPALQEIPVHRYAVLAAIAALHDEAPTWPETDWPQILGLYDLLVARWPSPVVELNRAVAISYVHGPAAALATVEPLVALPALATYPYAAATRADLLRRLGRTAEAAEAYREAAMLTTNPVEAAYLLSCAAPEIPRRD